MLSTSHIAPNIIADLLVAHGIRQVVMSPGSRNAPIIIALSRRKELECHCVIDERSAAFIALGMSVESDRPVAIVCTSGTALLNYAPAVAEAFYRKVPLIVISADRPEEWIDQDDSQTIWQQDTLKPWVKRAWDIPAHLSPTNGQWAVNRVINDALIEAVNLQKGPVHINMRLDAPLDTMAEYAEGSARVIRMTPSTDVPSGYDIERLASEISNCPRVMIVAGFMAPDRGLETGLNRLSRYSNIAVLTESISNLRGEYFVSRIDSTLSRISNDERGALAPEIVITLGGALVSRHIKEWLRTLPDIRHWHIGLSSTTVDCFRHLSRRINASPAPAINAIADKLMSSDPIIRDDTDYAYNWHSKKLHSYYIHKDIVASAPWSTLTAMDAIISAIPSDYHVHLSNGTAIRYAQLCDCSHIGRMDCNRGVSGIDGSTSTALGASVMNRKSPTLLITGDMSLQYDIAAFSSTLMSPRFKIIVLCNDGGEIFRFIKSTSSLPELEKYFACGTRLPLRQLCEGYGIMFHEARDMKELEREMGLLLYDRDSPSLLAVYTSGQDSAEILKGYFK